MKTMPAAQFKARCLRVMEEVHSRREPVLITKKGRPIARLIPASDPPASALGCLADRVEIIGDLVAPAVDPSEWAALNGEAKASKEKDRGQPRPRRLERRRGGPSHTRRS
jgi:prevent-host-death family protein